MALDGHTKVCDTWYFFVSALLNQFSIFLLTFPWKCGLISLLSPVSHLCAHFYDSISTCIIILVFPNMYSDIYISILVLLHMYTKRNIRFFSYLSISGDHVLCVIESCHTHGHNRYCTSINDFLSLKDEN